MRACGSSRKQFSDQVEQELPQFRTSALLRVHVGDDGCTQRKRAFGACLHYQWHRAAELIASEHGHVGDTGPKGGDARATPLLTSQAVEHAHSRAQIGEADSL